MEKIFLVPDTSFFAAKMMFSVAEKTVGGAGGSVSKPSTIQHSLETRRTVHQLTLDQRRQPDSRPPRKIAPEPRARTRQTHRPHQVDIIDVDGVGHPQG